VWIAAAAVVHAAPTDSISNALAIKRRDTTRRVTEAKRYDPNEAFTYHLMSAGDSRIRSPRPLG
jgi:hypothetical protein